MRSGSHQTSPQKLAEQNRPRHSATKPQSDGLLGKTRPKRPVLEVLVKGWRGAVTGYAPSRQAQGLGNTTCVSDQAPVLIEVDRKIALTHLQLCLLKGYFNRRQTPA